MKQFLRMCRTRAGLVLAALLIAALLVIPLGACTSGGDEITLTLVSGWPAGVAFNEKLMTYIDMVNADGAGKVFIDFKGGPEVAPITEAVGLVKKGVYDMVFSTPGYYGGLSPSCVPFYYLPTDPAFLRELGVHAVADQIMRDEMECAFLGWVTRGEPFAIASKEPITSADFSGILMHTLPMYTAALTYLGASTKTLQVPEFYQALQTGVVDAIPCPASTVIHDYKLYEQASYILFPLMPMTTSGEVIINAAKYDSLPADVQKILTDNMIEVEKEVIAFHGVNSENVLNILLTEKGMQKSELPPAEADKFMYAFTTYVWEQFMDKNPKWVPQLYDLVKDHLGE